MKQYLLASLFAGAVALPARYEIRYRTHAIDLTQTG